MSNVAEHLNALSILPRRSDDAVEQMNVWVPGEHVSVYELEMPDVPRRRWPDMLPWLLEDQLLRPSEELHFVVGPDVTESRILVYVVDKAQVSQWQLLAESKSLNLDHAVGWQLLGIEREQNEDLRLTALVEDQESIPDEWREQVSAQLGSLNWGFVELPDTNLMTGEFRAKKTTDIAPWFPVMGVAALAFVLAIGFMLIQSHQWKQNMGVLQQGIAEAYEDLLSEPFEGAVEGITPAIESRIRLLEHQNLVMQGSPVFELRSLDQSLSACRDCDVKKIVQGDGSITVTLKATDSMRAGVARVEGLSADWSTVNKQGVVNLRVSRKQ